MFSKNFCDTNYLFLILVLFSVIDTGVLLLILSDLRLNFFNLLNFFKGSQNNDY